MLAIWNFAPVLTAAVYIARWGWKVRMEKFAKLMTNSINRPMSYRLILASHVWLSCSWRHVLLCLRKKVIPSAPSQPPPLRANDFDSRDNHMTRMKWVSQWPGHQWPLVVAILDHRREFKMSETTQMLSFPELFFNVDGGYLEGLVRGLRSGILTQNDYLNLVQCETLEGTTQRFCQWHRLRTDDERLILLIS